VGHDGLVVLDDDDRLACVDEPVEQLERPRDVGALLRRRDPPLHSIVSIVPAGQ
jgi:hypothetical protein